MASVARPGSGRSQEPAASSGSPTWVAGLQAGGLFSATFSGALAGFRGLQLKHPGLKSVLKWHTDTTGSSLVHCVTTLLSLSLFNFNFKGF